MGIEHAGHPAWPDRARRLAARLAEAGPSSVGELLAWGRRRGWDAQLTVNVLAWADVEGLACWDGARWLAARQGRACARCGARFESRKANQRYCSQRCQRRAQAERAAARRKAGD